MRTCAVLVVLLSAAAVLRAGDKDTKPLSPAEAAKHVNEKCTVEMEVKSVGMSKTGGVAFLNSEEDLKDEKNFTAFVGKEAVEKYKQAKVEDLTAHFKGKTIRVTGTVKLYRERPEIVVDDPEQIQVVEKK
jgi:DNA/RNA endonuclease YhcR with UshA esterase domain